MRRILSIAILLVGFGLAAEAQKLTAAPERTRVLLILDCSQSMWDKWQSDAKIKVTQKVLLRLLDSIGSLPDMEVALRVYGHLNKEAYSTTLEVPFEPHNHYRLQSKIKTLVPQGECAAASALNNSLNDFPRDGNSRNIILIITDGLDDCEGSICDVAQQVQRSGTVVQTFIVGIGNHDDFKHEPDCVGQFTFMPDEELFDAKMHELFYLSDQKAQVVFQLTDSDHKPFEIEVPIIFYDHFTHAVRHSVFYHYDTEHPLDTLSLDPLSTYDITFFTQPPIRLFNYRFSRFQHLEVPAPMGSLRLYQDAKRTTAHLSSYEVLVRQHDSTHLLATQPLGTRRNYLVGRYDIDVLSLPPIHLSNVAIRDGAATELQIPLPGQLALNKPKVNCTGSIFVFRNGSLQWVCDLDPNAPTERITLMPGEYQVVLKPQKATDYNSARMARFTITAGKQTSVDLEKESR